MSDYSDDDGYDIEFFGGPLDGIATDIGGFACWTLTTGEVLMRVDWAATEKDERKPYCYELRDDKAYYRGRTP